MAAESPGRRQHGRRRRWVVPALLLGAGAGTWAIVRRRSAAEPVDVWAPRPPVERMIAAPTPAPPTRAPHPATPAAATEIPATEIAATESPATESPATESPATESPAAGVPAPAVRPLLAAPAPASGATATATAPSTTPYGPGSAAPLPDGGAPGPEYTIKGNASSRLFHPPSSPYYNRTRAEVWFRTADDAVAAGFSPYRSRRR